ncbi:Cloroperoxidase [Mycena venus]|uniref:Cloroperoxidase n=1 Tax=Mycena venus TaxID=2733690 RepID=A0A8H6Y926_9AGAR|nr:Cloroperoxidase [Mycena venus]
MRGPCPGLNSLANHNFIPHNGIVTLLASIQASLNVYGMALEAATFAGALGALYGGDLSDPTFPYSIGNPPPVGLLGGILGGLGLFGRPSGLSFTHNQFESDTSATRGDYFQFNGDAHHLQMPAFQELYNLQPESPDANYNRTVILAHRLKRIQDSVQQNPYFFYGPVQMVITCLTTALIPALMSNHSSEHPDGILSNNVLKSIYGVTGQNGSLVYTPGTERIPDNWYRRPILDPYGALHVVEDIIAMGLYDPQILLFGGNTNGPNTFAPLDLDDFTGGVYNAASLLQGNNAACFVFQAAQLLFPSSINGLLGQIVLSVLQKVLDSIGGILADLTCPELAAVNASMLEQYPGYRKSSHAV